MVAHEGEGLGFATRQAKGLLYKVAITGGQATHNDDLSYEAFQSNLTMVGIRAGMRNFCVFSP